MRKKVLAVLMLIAFLSAPARSEEAKKVAFIYYYAWYANDDYDGQWLHWQEYGHRPPWDVSSSFFPKLGPYSSRDPGTIDQHMRWIAGANMNVLIYSWWGRDDFTDTTAKLVLDSAADYDLKVSFLIEPYPGRTGKSICTDIEYLSKEYGNHPAFFRLSKATAYAPNPARRGVFFVYNPDYPDPDLRVLSDTVHASRYDSILLLQSTDAGLIDRTHADGIFAYEAVIDVMYFYKGIVQTVKQNNGIFVPCVAPGFNMNRTLGKKAPLFRSRHSGSNYDEWWKSILEANPEFVAIISFNEWHEGTQVEPAIPFRRRFNEYLSYDGAYGKTGSAAQQSYLRRTARWIHLFQQIQP